MYALNRMTSAKGGMTATAKGPVVARGRGQGPVPRRGRQGTGSTVSGTVTAGPRPDAAVQTHPAYKTAARYKRRENDVSTRGHPSQQRHQPVGTLTAEGALGAYGKSLHLLRKCTANRKLLYQNQQQQLLWVS